MTDERIIQIIRGIERQWPLSGRIDDVMAVQIGRSILGPVGAWKVTVPAMPDAAYVNTDRGRVEAYAARMHATIKPLYEGPP
jgi:hypothetical protein